MQEVDRTGCPARADKTGEPRHGDRRAYVGFGCRCADAREDYRLYAKRGREGRRQSSYVPALGAMRRLRGLAGLGYSPVAIGDLIGMNGHMLDNIRAGRKKSVLRSTDAAVAEFCRTVSAFPLPTTRAVTQVRNLADRRDWAPLIAWDDDTIHDPDTRPAHRAQSTGSYLRYDPSGVELEMAIRGYPPRGRDTHHPKIVREAVRHLADVVALPPAAIAERLNIELRTVQRIRSSLRSASAPEVLPASESPTPEGQAA